MTAALVSLAASTLVGCADEPSPSPSTPARTTEPTPRPTAGETASDTPAPSPEPTLSLELPQERDDRDVTVSVTPEVAPDGNGLITVTVVNTSDERIDEIVLRWPTGLRDTLFLAPFQPSDERISEGGSPLVQPWTKWVEGPGEHDEPADTTSLGYGPMDPGMTLTIPIYVTRAAPGPIGFDLQVLAGNILLEIEDEPAELRIEVP